MTINGAARAAGEREFALHDRDFEQIRQLVKERTGIMLTERKRELVYGRLVRRLRVLRLDSFASYCALLDGPDGDGELGSMINAITTNLTSFFREQHHFDHLAASVLQPLIATRKGSDQRLRLCRPVARRARSLIRSAWCCAMRCRPATVGTRGILANRHRYRHGRAGRRRRYAERGVAAIPPRFRGRYVERRPDGFGIAPAVRDLITFKPLNLLEPWPMGGPFDAIFCRQCRDLFRQG
ncbi:MAG: CheR family methyltransferase [Pseudomonadota bacterium]